MIVKLFFVSVVILASEFVGQTALLPTDDNPKGEEGEIHTVFD
jgi:hypothetical protein